MRRSKSDKTRITCTEFNSDPCVDPVLAVLAWMLTALRHGRVGRVEDWRWDSYCWQGWV